MRQEQERLGGKGEVPRGAVEEIPSDRAPSIEDLLTASLATLTATPTSAHAKAFVGHVKDAIERYEKLQGVDNEHAERLTKRASRGP